MASGAHLGFHIAVEGVKVLGEVRTVRQPLNVQSMQARLALKRRVEHHRFLWRDEHLERRRVKLRLRSRPKGRRMSPTTHAQSSASVEGSDIAAVFDALADKWASAPHS